MDTKPPVPPVRMHAEFDHIDELAAGLTGWDADLRQLNPGPARFGMSVLACPRTVVSEFEFSSSVYQRGAAPRGFVTFGFPPRAARLNWSGRDASPCELINFDGPNGFEGVNGENFTGTTVSFERRFFDRICDSLRLPVAGIDPADIPRVVDVNELQAQRGILRRLLHAQPDTFEADAPMKSLARFEEQFLMRFLGALDVAGLKSRERPLPERQRRLQKAIAYIDAHGRDNPSMPEICKVAAMSWRSLDRAFKERFGIGPKRFLLNYRLMQVRKQLKHNPSAGRVTSVANDWGFWHIGQFAADYSRFFGELPSATLRR